MFYPGISCPVRRSLPLHRGINFSSMEVGGDLGGFVFAAGSVVSVLVGLPYLIPFYAASVLLGVALALVLHAWHVRHPVPTGTSTPLQIGRCT